MHEFVLTKLSFASSSVRSSGDFAPDAKLRAGTKQNAKAALSAWLFAFRAWCFATNCRISKKLCRIGSKRSSVFYGGIARTRHKQHWDRHFSGKLPIIMNDHCRIVSHTSISPYFEQTCSSQTTSPYDLCEDPRPSHSRAGKTHSLCAYFWMWYTNTGALAPVLLWPEAKTVDECVKHFIFFRFGFDLVRSVVENKILPAFVMAKKAARCA